VETGRLAGSPAAQPAPPPPGAAAGTPSTVSADALPTAQINGIVWDQVVVGDIVYAVGKFSAVRPAGSPAGQNESPRSNAMAYNINTGEILNWAPTTNGTINAIAASADGQTLYLGGEFTTLNNQTAWRVGAVRASDGQRAPLGAAANGSVKALSVSPDGQTLYIGGAFTQINSSARQRVAALNLGSQQLTNFAPKIDNYYVRSIVEAVDGSAVAIGGAFESVGGSDKPGHGIAILQKDGRLANNGGAVVSGPGCGTGTPGGAPGTGLKEHERQWRHRHDREEHGHPHRAEAEQLVDEQNRGCEDHHHDEGRQGSDHWPHPLWRQGGQRQGERGEDQDVGSAGQ